MTNNTVGTEAFEDYTPQVVVMPRIAFSFPVGEKSQFKASYDIIARRPSSSWRADYFSYLYMSQITSISNPNLKPERITNYELDFQQALNDNNAISISAIRKLVTLFSLSSMQVPILTRTTTPMTISTLKLLRVLL